MKEIIIYKTKHLQIKLNPNQAYLGTCIIIAKRNISSLSQFSKEEWKDFSGIVKKLEFALKRAFGVRMFNWTCLMNNAFKTERYENKTAKPRVHWHCRPRYNKSVVFGGEKFEDLEFAHHYDKNKNKTISEEILIKIAEKIKEELK